MNELGSRARSLGLLTAAVIVFAGILAACADSTDVSEVLQSISPSTTMTDPPDDGDSGDDETDASTTTSTTTTAAVTATTAAGAASDLGTRDAPLAYGAPAAVTLDAFGDADESVWNTTVGEPTDVTAAVLAENQFNPAPPEGVIFAGFPVQMTLVDAGKEPLSAGFNFSWEILGGSTAAAYQLGTIETESFGCGVVPDSFDNFSEVFAGGSLTGTVCIPLPVEDFDHPDTQVAMNHIGGDRTVFGPDGTPGTAATPSSASAEIGTGSGEGTRAAPFAYGTTTELTLDTFGDADGSVWDITISAPADVAAAVLAENQFNDPPPDGVVFVGFPVEITLVEADVEPLSQSFNFTWEILGGSTAAAYQVSTVATEGFGCGVVPGSFDSFAEVFVGGTLTGLVCIPLPAEDFGHPDTQVAVNHSGGTRTVFGPAS